MKYVNSLLAFYFNKLKDVQCQKVWQMKYLSCEKIVALHLYKLKFIYAMTFCDKLVEIDPYILEK